MYGDPGKLLGLHLVMSNLRRMEQNVGLESISCAVCGSRPVFKCSRCRKTFYCGRQHQKKHWMSHKINCSLHVKIKSKDAIQKARKTSHESVLPTYCRENFYILDRPEYTSLNEMCSRMIISLQAFGFCVIDNLLKENLSDKILLECVSRYGEPGHFSAGKVSQVKKNPGYEHPEDDPSTHLRDEDIRGDQVTWLGDRDQSAPNITMLVKVFDQLALFLSRSGKFSDCNIKSRTRTMIACYPGNDTSYKKHVDNPNGDGRRLTFIFYLNKNYEREKNGGVLRIHKAKSRTHDIEPRFGRLIIFWSDKRTVHEVLPSFTTRFAISVWYFDADERARAMERSRKPEERKGITCVCVSREINIGNEDSSQNEQCQQCVCEKSSVHR